MCRGVYAIGLDQIGLERTSVVVVVVVVACMRFVQVLAVDHHGLGPHHFLLFPGAASATDEWPQVYR